MVALLRKKSSNSQQDITSARIGWDANFLLLIVDVYSKSCCGINASKQFESINLRKVLIGVVIFS